MSALIVIIDDEEDLAELLEYNLSKEGFETVGFCNVLKVEQFLEEEEPDLLIVDRNLIYAEGAQFVKSLRSKGFNTPVIFLSAKDSKEDRLQGFEAGGDDYITKPFDMDDLIARVKAVLKRTKKQSNILKFKDILVNNESKQVFINDQEVSLTKLEINLLTEFIINKNIVLSRDYLWDKIWGSEYMSEKTLNIAVKRLRQKLGNSDYIVSVRSQGYKIC
ncbi:response regulator transcription factor [Campylobacter sp. RM16192]|uniref:response regulator transcription factor n=1 Tax=Campylobacter sp. RM16192 TaxID=1660080 RepID=UPI001452613A|nr:response regulator transcription factor [Campylobacter sp. RM16192]QCD52008.1 two-component system response regulator [Campylobacter sp. RM16192]